MLARDVHAIAPGFQMRFACILDLAGPMLLAGLFGRAALPEWQSRQHTENKTNLFFVRYASVNMAGTLFLPSLLKEN